MYEKPLQQAGCTISIKTNKCMLQTTLLYTIHWRKNFAKMCRWPQKFLERGYQRKVNKLANYVCSISLSQLHAKVYTTPFYSWMHELYTRIFLFYHGTNILKTFIATCLSLQIFFTKDMHAYMSNMTKIFNIRRKKNFLQKYISNLEKAIWNPHKPVGYIHEILL